MIQFLADQPAASWARACYLLRTGGNYVAAAEVIKAAPGGQGPFYLGPRRYGGHYDKATGVIDTVVARYATAKQEG